MYSPHAWGWTAVCESLGLNPLVFPTRVGMDLHQLNERIIGKCIPHTRGDGPILLFYNTYIIHVFPTRVGMDHTNDFYEQAYDRIPHTRGDGPLFSILKPIELIVFPTRVGMDQEIRSIAEI